MRTANTTLGLFERRCELCGAAAPLHQGASRRGGFVRVRQSMHAVDESTQVWACEVCVPRRLQLVRLLLTPQQEQTLHKVRGEQGRFTERDEVIPPTSFQGRVEGKSSRLAVEDLAALHLLSSIKGLGPNAVKAVHAAGLAPADVIGNPDLYPLTGKRAQNVVTAMKSLTDGEHGFANQFAENQIQRARELDTTIISYDDSDYPPLIRESNNPIPILWARGNTSILRSRKTIACVGSRRIRVPYSELQATFADVAVEEGFIIASGFAMGADSIGHRRALLQGGSTICVMPCGVDLVFPPENRSFWHQLMNSGRAVFLSEFPLGRRAESLTLRKRNRLIVAAALGILVGQTSKSGGAMNAFRFGLEQKKAVATFEPDDNDDTSGNLEISESVKGNTSALPATVTVPEYRVWLRELFCST